MPGSTIAGAAKAAGVGVETIRFYERRGLIEQPPKPVSGYRQYGPATVARVRFIRQAQELGFSLSEIAELLSLRADPATDCADVRERAMRKREEVVDRIERLAHMRDALDALIAACPGGGGIEACTILDQLGEDGLRPPRTRPGRTDR